MGQVVLLYRNQLIINFTITVKSKHSKTNLN
jgi:hypothetical protein